MFRSRSPHGEASLRETANLEAALRRVAGKYLRVSEEGENISQERPEQLFSPEYEGFSQTCSAGLPVEQSTTRSVVQSEPVQARS